jgi:hypothetical protein
MEVQTKDNTQKHKTQNGEPLEEKSNNIRLKPFTSGVQQVMQ